MDGSASAPLIHTSVVGGGGVHVCPYPYPCPCPCPLPLPLLSTLQMVNSPRALVFNSDPVGHPTRSPMSEARWAEQRSGEGARLWPSSSGSSGGGRGFSGGGFSGSGGGAWGTADARTKVRGANDFLFLLCFFPYPLLVVSVFLFCLMFLVFVFCLFVCFRRRPCFFCVVFSLTHRAMAARQRRDCCVWLRSCDFVVSHLLAVVSSQVWILRKRLPDDYPDVQHRADRGL